MSTLKADVTELNFMVARIEERLSATLPHLATKADLTCGKSWRRR